MGEFLGMLAGAGMLLLIAALLGRFLRQCGLLTQKQAVVMLRVWGTVFGVGAAYLLAGALMHGVLYEPVDNPLAYNRFFCTPYLQKMYAALTAPSFFAPLSGAFAFLAHGLGTILLGQYQLAGSVMTLAMTGAGAQMVWVRLERIAGKKAAEEGLFLLLSMPGALFLFLPGWPPMAFLLVAGAFFLLGRRWLPRSVSYPAAAYVAAIALSAVLSAAVVYAVVTG